MPRGNQVARLYTLVMDLARSHRGVPVATLAERHGYNLRTVYRDMDALQAAGFPVVKEDSGAKYKLIDGWREEIPFPLSTGELLSLYVARDLMRPLGDAPPAKHFDSLMRKLAVPRARRKGKQQDLFPRFESPLSMPSVLAIDYEVHSETIETLWQARAQRRTVECAYYTASRDEETSRRLDPYEIHYDPTLESLYLFAWCHDRRGVRTFAVHRFRSVEMSDAEFERQAGFDVDKHLKGAFRIWRSENVQKVVLRLAPSARWVAERRWHESQKVEDEGGGSIRMELAVGDHAELRRFILGLGSDVCVLEPVALRSAIASAHGAAADQMLDGGGQGTDTLTLDDDRPHHSSSREASLRESKRSRAAERAMGSRE